jgi:hypothetical protein
VSEFEYEIPSSSILPFSSQVLEAQLFIKKLSDFSKRDYVDVKCSDFDGLIDVLKKLGDLYNQADNLQLDLTSEIIGSFFNGEAYLWKHKLEMASQIISKYDDDDDIKRIDKDVEVTYASTKSLKQYKNDAQVLCDYLKDGNSLTGITHRLKKPFLPRDIKERLPFISEVKVNGSSCDSISEFETVIKDIELRQDLDELSEIWNRSIPDGKLYLRKIVYYRNINREVSKLFGIIKESEELRKKIEHTSTIKITPFHRSDLFRQVEGAEYCQLLLKSDEVKGIISSAVSLLDQSEFHPIKVDLKDALSRLDTSKYAKVLDNLKQLEQNRGRYVCHITLKSSLESSFPNLLNKIAVGDFSVLDLPELKEAVIYKHAQEIISHLLDEGADKQLMHELSELEKKKKKTIAVLASKKAWYTVIDGLQDNKTLRRHLDAWVMAVRKIGKTGKGKRSIKFKRISQQEMEYCKDSVPCWIMPLYKVAETIRPQKGMYDYVIIDEASQLGPDAIFLLYISKNIIIVGDDKQTSPEYVGVDANSMMPHINRHLKEIPFKDYYGTEFSFFDHAKLFCDGNTVLREHFRCMPEIIEFSNKNFYAPDGKGLYPLKQYSENRLNPLETVFCPNGSVIGTGSSITNEPEALSIV